jgi:hypothetical protein
MTEATGLFHCDYRGLSWSGFFSKLAVSDSTDKLEATLLLNGMLPS